MSSVRPSFSLKNAYSSSSRRAKRCSCSQGSSSRTFDFTVGRRFFSRRSSPWTFFFWRLSSLNLYPLRLDPILKCFVSTQMSGTPPRASSTTSVVWVSAHRNGPKRS